MNPVETFPALDEAGVARHAFIGRIPKVDVGEERDVALERLARSHRELLVELGFGGLRLVTAEQVHGKLVQTVDEHSPEVIAGADGLVTNSPGVCLGIYVADCCAIYLVDPAKRAIGLVHSGKKGTGLRIVTEAISAMRDSFGTSPSDLIVQLSPCIRPPHYDTDFAAVIRDQCREAGVQNIHDAGTCTAANNARYYSYRLEKGRTGRMLALLALAPHEQRV